MYRSDCLASLETMAPIEAGDPLALKRRQSADERRLVGDRVDASEIAFDRLEAELVGAAFVHERGVKLADLAGIGTGRSVGARPPPPR